MVAFMFPYHHWASHMCVHPASHDELWRKMDFVELNEVPWFALAKPLPRSARLPPRAVDPEEGLDPEEDLGIAPLQAKWLLKPTVKPVIKAQGKVEQQPTITIAKSVEQEVPIKAKPKRLVTEEEIWSALDAALEKAQKARRTE